MPQPDPATQAVNKDKPRRKRRGVAIALACALALAGGYYFLPRNGGDDLTGTTFAVRKGPLEVTVLEGGSIEALDSLEIKSEVQGQTRILSIVEEGYYVTSDDVQNGLVLIELDATNLLERQMQEELQYQNAYASYAEAREQYEIQRNQNESDLRQAELDVLFARMDFEKYMGADVARQIINRAGAERLAANLAGAGEWEAAAGEDAGDLSDELILMDGQTLAPLELDDGPPAAAPRTPVDFGAYADPERLGDGEAGQRLRRLEDDLVLAEQEVGLAESQLEGTRRLYDREFVTLNELENDEMRLRRHRITLESAKTNKELFIRYEFPKEAESLLSRYEEALRRQERAEKLAVSRIAQAEARYRSAKARYDLQRQKKAELDEQIEKCVIRATTPGLVIYGDGTSGGARGNQEMIEEGAMVRERQSLITIPNMERMAVNVRVHESYVERVRRGQRARVRVDANRRELLTGEVYRIAVLPDAQNRWLNPDVRVYTTRIAIDESPEWLRPGMSARVEIIIESLDEVLHAPIQAVHVDRGEQVVYVVRGIGALERRPVRTGAFNDSFIEILDGLSEGERVALRAPADRDEGNGGGERERPAETPDAGGAMRPEGAGGGRPEGAGGGRRLGAAPGG